jgi:hypothetical protein
MDKVKVTTVKGFDNEGQYAKRNSVIHVTEQRARELEANGLVVRGQKAAPEPSNKMKPAPENKRRGAE